MTTFGSATFTLLRSGETIPRWLEPVRLDERDLLGIHETDVHVLGWGSAAVTVDVYCATQGEYEALLNENGKRSSLDLSDGSRTCVLAIEAARELPGGLYVVSCRFKVVS